MKVVFTSMSSLFVGRGFPKISKQLIHLCLIHLIVATAFGSEDVDYPQETERNIGDADFLKLKREVIDALKADAQNSKDSDFIRLKREVLEALKTKRDYFEESYGGAVYVRWGRTVCGPGSDALYRGVAGGSLWSDIGGGSNYLCLPLDPIWGAYNQGVEKYSKLYGSEYELPTGYKLNNNQNRPLHDNNVPCIVCRSPTKTSVVMIPARNQCYRGMHTEYTGFLVSAASVHQASADFVCMDGEPESDPAGYRDENGALFYNVEGVCGSLPCPPYAPDREITCAVCTK